MDIVESTFSLGAQEARTLNKRGSKDIEQEREHMKHDTSVNLGGCGLQLVSNPFAHEARTLKYLDQKLLQFSFFRKPIGFKKKSNDFFVFFHFYELYRTHYFKSLNLVLTKKSSNTLYFFRILVLKFLKFSKKSN
jgi:hypothetical protein